MTAKTKKVVSLLAFGVFWGSISLGFCGDAVRQEVAMPSTRLFAVQEMWSLDPEPRLKYYPRVQVRADEQKMRFELPGAGFSWGDDTLPLESSRLVSAGNEYVFVGEGAWFAPDAKVGGKLKPIFWSTSPTGMTFAPGDMHFTGNFAYKFTSDESYPLTFRLLKAGGAYLCGRGAITTPDGKTYQFGQNDTIETWLPLANHDANLQRQGAIQALGWLAKTKEEKDRVLPVLLAGLQDSTWEVRRNAAEALGRLADHRAMKFLTQTLQDEHSWVKAVAQEALEKIGKKE